MEGQSTNSARMYNTSYDKHGQWELPTEQLDLQGGTFLNPQQELSWATGSSC